MTATVAVLGVGHLAGYLVPRLAGDPRRRVVLSPRNRQRAEALAARHDNIRVARDNRALVGESDVVILATRPGQAAAAIDRLPWRPGQTLVSVCAGVRLDTLMFNAGAATLARAMPITAAALGESPTCLYPDVAAAREVLEALGPVYALEHERELDVATLSAALYGWVHGLIADMALLHAQAGLPPALARELVARTVRAAGSMVAAQPGRSLPELLDELCAPGGVTELGLQSLRDSGALEQWRRAAAQVLESLRED